MSLLPQIRHSKSQFAAHPVQDLIANAPDPHYKFLLPTPPLLHLHNPMELPTTGEYSHFTLKAHATSHAPSSQLNLITHTSGVARLSVSLGFSRLGPASWVCGAVRVTRTSLTDNSWYYIKHSSTLRQYRRQRTKRHCLYESETTKLRQLGFNQS